MANSKHQAADRQAEEARQRAGARAPAEGGDDESGGSRSNEANRQPRASDSDAAATVQQTAAEARQRAGARAPAEGGDDESGGSRSNEANRKASKP